MKYYAVTEDPNELLHYGRLGMKWGKHIFGDKPRSSGYKRALGKLKASVSKTKSSIQKSSAQRAITKQNKQQERYAKAVQKAQRRVNEIEGLNSLNKLQDYERAEKKALKEAKRNARDEAKMKKYTMRAERAAMKQDLKYAKNEHRMNKYLQQARQGKLKYGKLSDDQVRQITDRLGMERSARSLGSAEKTWGQQKKEAFRRGKLAGIERGTAAAMEEVARGATVYGITKFMNRAHREAWAKQQGKEENIRNKERNKRSHKDIRDAIKNEAYEAEVREGQHWGAKSAANSLKEIEKSRLEDDRKRRLQARLQDEIDTENNAEYQKLMAQKSERERVRRLNETMNNALDMERNKDYQDLLTRQEEQRFLTDEAHNAVRNARQNRENEERAERQRELAAELAYKYNIFPSSNNNGGGGNKKKNGGGGGNPFNNLEEAQKYYERKHIRGETIQDEQARALARKAEHDAKLAADFKRHEEEIALRRKNEEMRRKAQEWVKQQNNPNLNIVAMNRDNKNGDVHITKASESALGWTQVRRNKGRKKG